MRVPVGCSRCGCRIGWNDEVKVVKRAVCQDCVDKPLEVRVAELEQRVSDLVERVNELGATED